MKGMQISRTYEITDLAAVIRSTESTQIVLSFPNGKDLRIEDLNKNQVKLFVGQLKARFLVLAPTRTLKMYAVPFASLKDYCYDNTVNYGLENLPIDDYRLIDEEFVGA